METVAPLSDFQIEKLRASVVLHTIGGQRLSGEVFLQPYTQQRRGREEIVDLLNGAEPFLPLRGLDGVIRFIAKARVLQAELDEVPLEEDDRRLDAREAIVEVKMVDGSSCNGCILYEVPTARPRLLDYLNRLQHRFVVIHSGSGARLINRHLIDTIRPLD